jgi:sugar transferase (PEP-CTERM/EpsH1 system associated)
MIAHVVYHFGTGGMENGMVMLFNHLPEDKYRHAVISLTGHGDFRGRIRRRDIQFHDLGKRPGHDMSWYPRLAILLRQLRPAILHTRNLNAMEAQFVGAWVGVPGRVHGEHGRDVHDLEGRNWKYNLLRRAARWVIHQYIAVSQDLAGWLTRQVGVSPQRLNQIYNGVDGQRFHPRQGGRPDLGNTDFFGQAACVIGSVGRLVAVKDYPTLLRAFARLRSLHAQPDGLRLIVVGDGPEREALLQLARELGIERQFWLPGDRQDIADWLRAFDLFVLPSIGEGISNTILEAMASGLPVVASRVGGNPELVREGENGQLFPVGDADALANALQTYSQDDGLRVQAGIRARQRVESDFVIDRMAASYAEVYDGLLARQAKE